MNSRVVQAKLLITCEVVVDDDLIKNIEDQYTEVKDDEDAAAQALFAFLNPKLPTEDQVIKSSGAWDGVCDFKDRFARLQLTSLND
ncbi:hypothetical protein [Paenibacillus cremeus]|uniref:Uncharacterized protein n=1 Tax=Paenibacillus cremeus TaxID=2163881 RepID=A0A559KAA7_9BACL|nr:hypothetical protein [Paenibacillus cremeus]TVY09067.1 hypothetical protein FPZ49_15245 [Paenibacillus cremeus]